MLERDGLIWFMLKHFAPMAPMFLLWLAAMVLSLLRWRRHRGVSAAVLLASLLQILALVTSIGLTYLIMTVSSLDDMNHYFFLSSLLNGALSTLSWALILLAVFGWRSHPGAAFARVDEDH